MKLSELMKDVTPNAQYTGWTTNDDFVLAIDLTPGAAQATEESAYGVVQMGVAGLDAQMNPVTQDKQYIRAGQSTQKTGTQRSFTISGDRYVGDEVQDYIFSHDIKYGTGNTVVPLRYNNDKQKKPLFSRGLSVCRLLFNSFSKLKIDENYKEKRRLFY